MLIQWGFFIYENSRAWLGPGCPSILPSIYTLPLKMNWQYTVESSIETDEPIMLINTHIGYDDTDGKGIDGAIFQQELLALDNLGKKAIQVWINSPGGIVTDGYNIYTAIRDSKTKVDTYGCGVMASIAGVIFQAGRNRVMNDYSWLLYHNAFGGAASDLKVINSSISTMISSRCGMSEEEVLKMMDRTTRILPKEALEKNLCDEISYSKDKNRKHGNSNDIKAFWKESNLILNNILKPKNKKMQRVANRLKLNPDASEDSFVSAIDAIENKSKADMETMQKKYDEMMEKCEAMKKEMDEAKEKAKNMEEEMKNEQAKNLVESFVKEGRIKVEATNKWVEMATKIGIESVKNLLEELPITKVATKIEVEKTSNDSNLTNVIANKMAELRAK